MVVCLGDWPNFVWSAGGLLQCWFFTTRIAEVCSKSKGGKCNLQRVQPHCYTLQKKVKNVTASMFIVQHVRELKNEIEIGATIFVWTIRQLAQETVSRKVLNCLKTIPNQSSFCPCDTVLTLFGFGNTYSCSALGKFSVVTKSTIGFI